MTSRNLTPRIAGAIVHTLLLHWCVTMKTNLRKIGNSRGVLIPAPLLAACEIMDEVELTIEEGRLVVAAVKPAREGWFDHYDQSNDQAIWPESGSLSADAEWEW